MIRLGDGLRSSIGTKFLMAVSGVLLLGFVVAHMLGNLQLFLGHEALDSYAQKIQDMGALLWVARAGLFTLLVLHVGSALKLTRQNRAARPIPYGVHKPFQSSYASRTMVMSGVIVLAFVLYHLLHFTFGAVDAESYALAHAGAGLQVHAMVVHAFQQPIVALSYMLAMALLSLHIAHGVGSLFQTLGLNTQRTRCAATRLGKGVGAVVFLGNVSMPLAVLAGWVGGN
ncbi:MAG: succinate dehydrogenase cytochrome b subunit [Planctomycetes bacterium]|nr:succinate dehydrogenase cytochrome b subunit [Planctomycetota bacterium]